ncbi:MAG TPA: zf-HC2 domain-containing protein [Vicinamibacterales bacterium]|nr:zf-HC2 domain-containing protein [Vicinamibacterales bacterium]
MMTCTDAQSRLSDLIDGGLAPDERAEVDAHLNGCALCRGVLSDLQRLRRAAAALGPVAPPDHVWLEVAGLTRLDRPASRVSGARPVRRAALSQWLGLAAALVVVTLGYYFVRSVPVDDSASGAGNAAGTASVKRIADELALAMQHYDNAITELESFAKANKDVLDPQMTEALRQNIQTVNAAIDESRTAFEQNPDSNAARESLFEALRRKVVVLQATVNLMNEMRKGNQTGAVEAAAVFTKKS